MTVGVPPAFPVLILGVMKSGTTALCERLFQHPALVTAHTIDNEPAHWAKELHYFDAPNIPNNRYSKGIGFYHQHFFPYPPPQDHRLIDCTPTYLGSVDAPRRVASTYAASREAPKFVLVLRDPLDRAVSHWSHAVTMSHKHRKFGRLKHWTVSLVNAGNFSTFTDMGIAMWNQCENTTWPDAKRRARLTDSTPPTVWESCGANGLLSRHGGFVYRGMVDEQLANWRRQFPESAFCMVSMGNLHRNLTAVVRRVAVFLGLDPAGRWADKLRVVDPHSHPKQGLANQAAAIERLRGFYSRRSRTYNRLIENDGWLNC